MSAYERFIEEAATRLELGARSRWAVEIVATWISAHPLGLDGLEQQFEQAGLGARYHSWLDPAQSGLPIIACELERALGVHALATLARKSRMTSGEFRVVACDLFPGVVALMASPTERANFERRIKRHQRGPQRTRMVGIRPSTVMCGVAVRSMLWLLAGLVVLGVTSWVYMKMHRPLWVAQELARDHEASLSLSQQGTQVTVHGRLPSEADRRGIWNALVALHGAGNVRGDIALDPSARDPRWLPALIKQLPQLQGNGLSMSFEGKQLHIDSTSLPESDRFSISKSLREAFSGLAMDGLWGPGLSALHNLPVDASHEERVAALNLTTLKFHPGSSELTGDSLQTVTAIADALRIAPADARIRVAAHTDSAGSPEASLQLSQNRAEQVVRALREQGVYASMLIPEGFGQDQPVADNRTELGRAQNQRVDYQLIQEVPR